MHFANYTNHIFDYLIILLMSNNKGIVYNLKICQINIIIIIN